MNYITIATINGEKFKNVETFARTVDKAEKIAMMILKSQYVGEIVIIRTLTMKDYNDLLRKLKIIKE